MKGLTTCNTCDKNQIFLSIFFSCCNKEHPREVICPLLATNAGMVGAFQRKSLKSASNAAEELGTNIKV
jgi:hypothetical protein